MISPSLAQIHLLRAAVNEPESALAHFAQWTKNFNIERASNEDSRIFPLIYWNIGAKIQDKEIASRLRGIARHTWLANRLRIELCAKAIDVLAKQEIPCLALKGAAMNAAVLNDASVRTMADCDILVPLARARDAAAALKEEGLSAFQLDPSRMASRHFRELHGLAFREINKGNDIIDLHWRPLRPVTDDMLTVEFFAGAKQGSFAGRKILVPSFEHLFLHSAIHGATWSESIRYDWIADLSLIIKRAGHEFDWDVLFATAKRFSVMEMLRPALALAQQAVDLKIPTKSRIRSHFPLPSLERYDADARMAPPTESLRQEALCLLQETRRSSSRLSRLPAIFSVPKLLKNLLWPEVEPINPFGGNFYHVAFPFGWSYSENSMRWSVKRWALMVIRLPADRTHDTLYLQADTFSESQVVDVYFGFRKSVRLSRAENQGRARLKAIPIPRKLPNGGLARIWFRIREPISPARIGASIDLRPLGIRIADVSSMIALIPNEQVHFTRVGAGDRFLGEGWSFQEAEGIWTDGKSAALRWQSDQPSKKTILLRYAKFFAHEKNPLTGSVSLNGETIYNFSLAAGSVQNQFEIKPFGGLPAGEIELRIDFDNPRSPQELNISNDPRRLGLMLESIQLID